MIFLPLLIENHFFQSVSLIDYRGTLRYVRVMGPRILILMIRLGRLRVLCCPPGSVLCGILEYFPLSLSAFDHLNQIFPSPDKTRETNHQTKGKTRLQLACIAVSGDNQFGPISQQIGTRMRNQYRQGVEIKAGEERIKYCRKAGKIITVDTLCDVK